MVFLSAKNTDPNDIKWIIIISGLVIFFEGMSAFCLHVYIKISQTNADNNRVSVGNVHTSNIIIFVIHTDSIT